MHQKKHTIHAKLVRLVHANWHAPYMQLSSNFALFPFYFTCNVSTQYAITLLNLLRTSLVREWHRDREEGLGFYVRCKLVILISWPFHNQPEQPNKPYPSIYCDNVTNPMDHPTLDDYIIAGLCISHLSLLNGPGWLEVTMLDRFCHSSHAREKRSEA